MTDGARIPPFPSFPSGYRASSEGGELGLGEVLGTAERVLGAVPELEAFVAEIGRIVEESRSLRESQAREVMTSREAAEFLRMPWQSFREIAPSLPRHAITRGKFVYLRSELLEWLSER